jgi:hypothetical protein
MVGFFKRKKDGKAADGADSIEPGAASGVSSFEHPPLEAGNMLALSNVLCPVIISTQGFSCEIDYLSEEQKYRFILKSKNKLMSDELIDPKDRKKKAVTDFSYKGLFGIHVHPSGILLLLDQEEDFKGQPRKNQPPATITSRKIPAGYEELQGRRLSTIDLAKCTENSPLLISPNHALYHMQVKPLTNEEGRWGLYLSNPKGFVREDSPAVVILEPYTNILIDRKFFTSRTSGDGGIDARNWNKVIADPVVMRLQVDKNNQLSIEEMFTISGMTLMLESGPPTSLGHPGTGSAEHDTAYQKQFAEVLVGLQADTASEGSSRDMEHNLLKKRNAAIAAAALAIKKINQDGVSKLAVELAIKEILAPFYSGDSGAETASNETIGLLNAIVGEMIGWIEADTSRALAMSAVEEAIAQSASALPWDGGVEEIMTMYLPEVQAHAAGDENANFGDLAAQAQKFLTKKTFIRKIRQIAKDLKVASEPQAQQEQVRQFNTLISEMVKGSFEQTLVRIAIKSHLVDTEKGRRSEFFSAQSPLGEVHITANELDNILKRYDSYAQFSDRAFADRIERSLGSIIQDFQRGSNSEDESSVTTKPYLTYLIALRASGGAIGSDAEAVAPAISSLMGIPDVIPNISVSQPTSGASTAMLTITHREGILLEVSFALAPRSDNVPDDVSNGLWYGTQDFAKFIMVYHLTGEMDVAKNQKQVAAIVTKFTKILLLKVLNFYRELNKTQVSNGFEGAVEMIGGSAGSLEVVLGTNPEDEFLDVCSRPRHISEKPLDIRAALHKVIVSLEKSKEVGMGAYRFRKRSRTFAMTGTGKGSLALLPISIIAKDGLLVLQAKNKEIKFEKSIRLVESKVKTNAGDAEFSLATQKSVKKLSQKAICELMHGLSFFKEFSVYEKTKIAEFDSSFKIYRKGEIVLREDSKDIAFFVVIKGHVRAVKGGFNIVKYGMGDMFGEIAFMTGIPQNLTAEALTNMSVLRVDQEMFSSLGPESREKFKNHIIKQQVRSLRAVCAVALLGGNDSFQINKIYSGWPPLAQLRIKNST